MHHSAVGPKATREDAFNELARRASAAREADRIAAAIDLYRQALQMLPSWHEGWWYLGTLFYEQDRYAEAREAFDKLLSLKPKGGVGWAMLGLCEFQLRQYDVAFEHLQQARVLGVPDETHLSVVSRYHLALLLNRMGKPEVALKLLYALARREGDSPSIITALGLCALALPHLPAELPQDQSELATLAGRAQYYMATRQMAEARKASEQLISRYSNTANVHYSFGVFLLLQEPDAALDQFHRELQISVSHVSAWLQIAFEYIKRSEYAKGLPYAEEAVKLAPQLFAARNALGRILLGMGETGRAIQELETGVKLAPDSPDMHFALARAYAQVGRKQDAARARTEFQKLDKIRRIAMEGSQAVGGIDPEEGEASLLSR